MFTQRHFIWLAKFAAAHLTPDQTRRLADELAREAPRFKHAYFLDYVERQRAPPVEHCDTAFINALKGPLAGKSDAALADEWHHWNERFNFRRQWGASGTAALEFRKDAEREIDKRGIKVTGYNN